MYVSPSTRLGTAGPHSHWGAELALQGARLRLSRTYLAAQPPTCQAGMTFGTSSIGFDPAESAQYQYAAEAAPILGGPPSAEGPG